MLLSDYQITTVAAHQGASRAPAEKRGLCIVRLFDEQRVLFGYGFPVRFSLPARAELTMTCQGTHSFHCSSTFLISLMIFACVALGAPTLRSMPSKSSKCVRGRCSEMWPLFARRALPSPSAEHSLSPGPSGRAPARGQLLLLPFVLPLPLQAPSFRSMPAVLICREKLRDP